MFMFEDIVTLDDRGGAARAAPVDTKDLAVALKGVKDEVREKIIAQHVRAGRRRTSSRRSTCSARSGVKQVEEAQAAIVRQIRALEEAGEIVVSRGVGR